MGKKREHGMSELLRMVPGIVVERSTMSWLLKT